MYLGDRAGLGVGIRQVGPAARDPGPERVLPELPLDLETFVVAHEDFKDVRRIRIVFDDRVAGLTDHSRD